MKSYLDPRAWLRGLIQATIRPRPRSRLYRWLDANVVIPESSGGPFPGRMRTARFAIFRGIYDLCQRRGVHYVTLCASARVGKTLFSICIVLYWIAERFGAVAWLDPTHKTATKLVRSELDEFLLLCPPVRALAIISKKTWTTLFKTFRGKSLRVIAAGAEADLHGFNAECVVSNETDNQNLSLGRDSSSEDKVIARTKMFTPSRLIVRNSTIGKYGELGPIWQNFLKGSQHYAYLPCPHCSAPSPDGWTPPHEDDCEPGRSPLSYQPGLAGWQRLTFFVEKKLVPFDADLQPLPVDLPRDQWREEITGLVKFDQFANYEELAVIGDPSRTERVKVGYRIAEVEAGATYQCACCAREIEWVDLAWMLPRFRWMSHHRGHDPKHLSFHVNALLSPFEFWGVLAAEFIAAKGDLMALIKFWHLSLGIPLNRLGTAVKEDDLDRVIARSPVRYLKGQIPMEAERLTITVDKQETCMWYVIRAYGILWDHPERPTWSALVDWGEIVSWEQVLEVAGLREDREGHFRRFQFVRADGTVREYQVCAGMVDSGADKQAVYDFCVANRAIFNPSKGGDDTKTGGNPTRLLGVMEDAMDLVWYWSDLFAADLYYSCIKFGMNFSEPVHWWLPTNLDEHYRKQLCDEFQEEEKGKKVWKTRTKNNHLGDCEKLQRVQAQFIETGMKEIRAERAVEEAAAAKASRSA